MKSGVYSRFSVHLVHTICSSRINKNDYKPQPMCSVCYRICMLKYKMCNSLPLRCNSPTRAKAASFLRFLGHTQWHAAVSRTPLDEGSTLRRDLYVTTHKRQTSMPPTGFEPAIPASDRPQTLALDSSATDKYIYSQYNVGSVSTSLDFGVVPCKVTFLHISHDRWIIKKKIIVLEAINKRQGRNKVGKWSAISFFRKS